MCYQKKKRKTTRVYGSFFISHLRRDMHTILPADRESATQHLTFITLKFIEIQEKNIPPQSGRPLITTGNHTFKFSEKITFPNK